MTNSNAKGGTKRFNARSRVGSPKKRSQQHPGAGAPGALLGLRSMTEYDDSGNESYDDEQTLRRLYHGDGLTQQELADRLGCSKPTIIKYMREFGIESRDVGGSDPDAPYKDEATLRRLYEDGRLNTYEIADRLDTSDSTVRYWMDEFGIERVPMGPRQTPPGLFISHNGYEVFEPDGERVRHHRLLAVAEYGFDAVVGNDVHHGDDPDAPCPVPWANWPANLRVWGHAAHARHHALESEFWTYRENYDG